MPLKNLNKKFIFPVIFLSLVLAFGNLVWAQDNGDNVTTELEELLDEATEEPEDEGPTEEELAALAEIERLKEELAVKEEEAKALDEEAQEIKGNIEEKQQEKRTLNNQIYILNSQIKKLTVDINLNANNIDSTSLKISRLNLLITRRTSEIERRKNLITETVRLINEYDEEGLLAVVLKNKSLSSFLDQLEHVQSLQRSLSEGLLELKEFKAQLISERAENEGLKKKLEELEIQLEDRKDLTASRRGYQDNLLRETKNQEKEYQRLLSEVEQQQLEIQKNIFEIEDKLRILIDPTSIPTPRELFIWPAQGRLSQIYGPTSKTGFVNDYYKFHNGVDTANSYGTEIRAALEGVVEATGSNGKYAYGRWIAIRHPDFTNMITLYAHLSKVRVSKGQKVEQGDLIGYMGSTGFSTGSHLHFTVYVSDTFKVEDRWYGDLPLGGTVDPLNYLPSR
jgi:murein DD-endopeptidase MepM/ murein hydrolase activator NlpD